MYMNMILWHQRGHGQSKGGAYGRYQNGPQGKEEISEEEREEEQDSAVYRWDGLKAYYCLKHIQPFYTEALSIHIKKYIELYRSEGRWLWIRKILITCTCSCSIKVLFELTACIVVSHMWGVLHIHSTFL